MEAALLKCSKNDTHRHAQVFRIVSVTVGTPPATFTWQYYDKSKVPKEVGPITPLEFYTQHVKPLIDVETKVRHTGLVPMVCLVCGRMSNEHA